MIKKINKLKNFFLPKNEVVEDPDGQEQAGQTVEQPVETAEETVEAAEEPVAEGPEVEMEEIQAESKEVTEPEIIEEPVKEAEAVEEPEAEVEPEPEVVEEPVQEMETANEPEPVKNVQPEFADQVRADIQIFAIGLQNQLEQLTAMVMRQNELICSLQSELEAKDELLRQQEETIRAQSMRLEKFNDDIVYKTQKPLIEELISIADFVRMVLGNDEMIEAKDFDALLNYFVRLKEWVAASLSNNSVREYSLAEDDPKTFDPKRQEITENEVTDDPALDNTYKTDRPGYIWTMPYLIVNNEARMKRILEETKAPKMFEFIIRCEEVIKVKYRKPAEEKPAANEE